jgi:hypothetical protein
MDRPAGKGAAPPAGKGTAPASEYGMAPPEDREVMSKLRTHNGQLTMGLAAVCHSPAEGSWPRVLT